MTIVDLCFPLTGTSIPKDHGYALYAAITTNVPALHGAAWLGVHPLGGRLAGDLLLLADNAELRLRVPVERIPTVLPLAGKRLDVAGAVFKAGAPVVRALAPRASLDARIVLLKLTRPPTKHNAELNRDVLDNDGLAQRYAAELERQLARLEVKCDLQLRGRRSITIQGKRVIGYSVRLANLDADGSLRVQERGLGGRRVLGCGIFRPTRGPVDIERAPLARKVEPLT